MQRNKRERKAPPTFEAGQGGGLATSSKATGSKANEGANDGSDDDSNWCAKEFPWWLSYDKESYSRAVLSEVYQI